MQSKTRKIAIECFAVLILGALFTFLAVYDSDKLSFTSRFVFWTSLIAVGTLIAAWVRPWVNTQLLPHRPAALQLLTLSAIVAAPIPVMLFGFDTGFKQAWPAWNWALQYLLSFIIIILFITGRHIVLQSFGNTATPRAAGTAQSPDPVEKFLQRLPVKFHGASLHAVSSEDHYLRIYTDRGDELILMRLADALHELVSVDGLQTHRSWWVARQGVAKIIGENGKKSLVLKCGTEALVARSRAKKVREAFAF